VVREILLIEDNIMNCELVKDTLEMENYSITTINNGSDALDILKSKSFDLILTDINLPRMDGIEFMSRAREICNNCSIIAMTSDSKTKDGKSFQEIGFDGYIQKPFKVSEFRQYIRSLIGTCLE
jgi:Response regulators consisting of a CheY-like receiver domain and a winged-helix DNA-binding domain